MASSSSTPDFALKAGPIARRLVGLDEATLGDVHETVANVLAEHVEGSNVTLPGGIWLLHARA